MSPAVPYTTRRSIRSSATCSPNTAWWRCPPRSRSLPQGESRVRRRARARGEHPCVVCASNQSRGRRRTSIAGTTRDSRRWRCGCLTINSADTRQPGHSATFPAVAPLRGACGSSDRRQGGKWRSINLVRRGSSLSRSRKRFGDLVRAVPRRAIDLALAALLPLQAAVDKLSKASMPPISK